MLADTVPQPSPFAVAKFGAIESNGVLVSKVHNAEPTSPRLAGLWRPRPFRIAPHQISMATLELQIDKMHCGACVRRVTQTINAVPATHAKSVQLGAASVTVDGADTSQLLQALEAAGFPAHITQTQP
jgi:copper chaperone